MEREAVCVSGTGLEGGEQGLLRSDGTSTSLENWEGLEGTPLSGSLLWISFSVEIL